MTGHRDRTSDMEMNMNTCKMVSVLCLFIGLSMSSISYAWVHAGGYGGYHGGVYGGDYHGAAAYGGYHYGGGYYGGRVVGGVDSYYDPACTMVDQCLPNLTCALQEVCE